MNGFETPQEWTILFSQNLSSYVHCICGHRVKRISYVYHKPTKTVKSIGKTCVKKYGINATVTNSILLDVTKEYCILSNKDNIDDIVREYILSKHSTFMRKIGGEVDIDYYDVVAPFRKLLTNVCDLVSEYGFDLVDLLRDIERDVESMNHTTRHTMVDEYDIDEYSLCDTISEIASEHYDESEFLKDKDEDEFDVVCKEMIEKMVEEVLEESKKEMVEEVLEESKKEMVEEKREHEERIVIKETKEQKEKRERICCMYSGCLCELRYRIRKIKNDLVEYRLLLKTLNEGTKEFTAKVEAFQKKQKEDKANYDRRQMEREHKKRKEEEKEEK
jgi:hypothetical protein